MKYKLNLPECKCLVRFKLVNVHLFLLFFLERENRNNRKASVWQWHPIVFGWKWFPCLFAPASVLSYPNYFVLPYCCIIEEHIWLYMNPICWIICIITTELTAEQPGRRAVFMSNFMTCSWLMLGEERMRLLIPCVCAEACRDQSQPHTHICLHMQTCVRPHTHSPPAKPPHTHTSLKGWCSLKG